MKIPFFWDVMPCQCIIRSQHFDNGEDGLLPLNVRMPLPTNAASYPRRVESSPTPQQRPQILQGITFWKLNLFPSSGEKVIRCLWCCVC